MKTGDKVRVYPHGSPSQAAEGVVLLLSDNQRSICVSFDEKPSFAVVEERLRLHPGDIHFLGLRQELSGTPWGPWIEVFGQGHYEIEEVVTNA